MQSILDPKWQVFVKVAELGSLTRAAASLGVPQSMISRHVGHLERECKARLFRRTGRGVVLTELGEQLFPRIKALIADAHQLADDIQTSGGLPMGEVSVGLLPSAVRMLAGRLFSLVRECAPKVRLRVVEAASAQLEEQLREGRLDMALVLREDETDLHDVLVLVRLALHLVGAHGDPLLLHKTITFDALAGLPLILPSRPHLLRARLDRLALARNIELQVAVEADSVSLQHEIAAAGIGYAITAAVAMDDDGARLATSRIVKPVLQRAVVLATTLQRPHTLATREVHRLIAQLAPTLLKP